MARMDTGNISPTFQPSQRLSQLHLTEELKIVLAKVGVKLTLSLSEPTHILEREQALVVRELTKYFESKDTQLCSKNFSIGLKYLCKKEKHLKKFLTQTEFRKTDDENDWIYQESLISIFLKIPHLQDEVMELLLDNVTDAAIEDTEDTSWLRTLLQPLRFLPTVKNSEFLAKKLLDILEISSFTCRLEILGAFPEILPDNQCDFAAKELTKLFDENGELCGALVDCLSALNVDTETKKQINDRVLVKISANVCLKDYLILIKFLLSDCKILNMVPTLLKIRNSLDRIIESSGTDKDSEIILIFRYLQRSASIKKTLADGWLNLISNINHSYDHKPVDLLIIFMLHQSSDNRRRVIEAIFRKRVSLGLFKLNLLEKFFEKYFTPQLLKNYLADIIDIGSCLLGYAKDTLVAKFATNLFQLLFNNIHVGPISGREILSSLISLTGSNDDCTTNTLLKLIKSLVDIDSKKVQKHINLLMQLLEKIDTMKYRDIKITFDILCSLLCGDKAEDFLSGFKDQIFNTIRKQLSCYERSVRLTGIISAITMVKHCASVSIYQGELTLDELDQRPIPNKEAVELLELVNCATSENSEQQCLYYDQLASILASEKIFDKYFLYWLYKKVHEDFEKSFLKVYLGPKTVQVVGLTMQFMLNKPEELVETLAVNIGGYTMYQKNDKILILAPYFRVLRLLHFRQHGNLLQIDSLLGCGIILPEENLDFENLNIEQIKLVADCLFHCINWFRETISAFVTEKDTVIQQRVIKRLDNLIDVEDKLHGLLRKIPGHNLPLSYFDGTQIVSKQLVRSEPSIKNPRKKVAKSNTIVNNESSMITETQINDTQLVKNKKKGIQVKAQKLQFRELDTDLVLLIKYPLNLDSMDTEENMTLNLQQIKFILNDFIEKLTLLTQTNKNVNLSHFNDVKADYLMHDCVRIVKNLNKFLEIIVKKINEFGEDAPYSEEAVDIQICFGSILQIFYLIFQWPGFQNTNNSHLLQDILESARDSCSQNPRDPIVAFVNKIVQYTPNCLQLSHGASLIKIMDVLNSLSASENKKQISTVAETFLKKRWYDFQGKLDQGRDCNQNTDILVKAYLDNFNVESILALVEILVEDIEALNPRNGCLNKFPAIFNKNFHVFFAGLCNALLATIKIEIQALTNSGHLVLWRSAAEILANLMNIAKTLKNRSIFLCFLKKTTQVLKIFLASGMPILEIMLKHKAEEVVVILKTIQTSTRFLNYLCCQAKQTRDASLVAYIPSFTHTRECLTFRVKAALVANDLSTAIWVGNLKNRNIEGEDIISQSTVASSSQDPTDIDNDQLPSDDDDDENIINGSDNEAESEVYG
ncbi:unnamed protein product [Ceutorhynchus assimilis]|uniref:Fanconi anemia group D2 protein n=1 Tax=Ceutorhynchus assimilis TaxID=467358 RepID=A0A9N9MS97_9CUCU|nr:unnamed protein product [Ceutorhynchus assimilis]